MKKFLVLSLAVILVMAFGATVYAQDITFKASGFIDAVSVAARNVPTQAGVKTADALYGPFLASSYRTGSSPGIDWKDAFMKSQARFKFDWLAGKDATGTIQFEMDSAKWGERTVGTSSAPFTAPAGKGQIGIWDSDAAGLEIKHVYFAFGIPGVTIPVTLQVGQQPVAFGPRIAVNNDGMGVTAAAKVDPATIKLGWYKIMENQTWASDDADMYAFDVGTKVQTSNLGLYAVNMNFNTYPLPKEDTSTVDYRGNFWWIGFYADGKYGPVNYWFDACYDNGKVEDRRGVAAASRAKDVKYRGFGTKLKVDYPYEKFNFGFVGYYATGADTKKTNPTGMPNEQVGYGGLTDKSSKVSTFVGPPPWGAGGSGDSIIVNSDGGFNNAATSWNGSGSGVNRGAMGGLWTAKVYGSYKVSPTYKVTLRAAYFADTTKNGNTFGNAKKADGIGLRDDSDVGWELALLNEVDVYKSVKFNFGGSILYAGDATDMNVLGATNVSIKNPYVLTTRLVYTF